MAGKKTKAVKDKGKKENKEHKEEKGTSGAVGVEEGKEVKTVKNREDKDREDKEILTVGAVEEKEVGNPAAGGETVEFSGKYIKAVGRRKRAIARVRLFETGKGIIIINSHRAVEYFPGEGLNLITQPLKVTGHGRDFNFSVIVKGGGKHGQIDAVRLGISRAILAFDPATKEALKVNGFLVRDSRRVERKKAGLKKARKAPQWSKR